MASPGNRHCANCIDTLSFPIRASCHTHRRSDFSKNSAVAYRVNKRSRLSSRSPRLQTNCRRGQISAH